MNTDVLMRYFTEDISPQEFLDELHDIMTEYSMMVTKDDEFNMGLRTAQRIGFMRELYDTIRQASRT